MKHKNKKGFTLIELLVVVSIMGLLAALAIVALSQARLRARDARRVADIKQIQTALELFYLDNNAYPDDDDEYTTQPTAANPGGSLDSKCISATNEIAATCAGTIYMSEISDNPAPRNDGTCANTPYTYARISTTSYIIEYCLGSATGDLAAGYHCATPAGISNPAGACG